MFSRIAAVFFLATATLFAETQSTLFVSPTGGGASFSQTEPGNLLAARNLVRTMSTAMTGNIVVYLYGGTYQLTNSFQLQENTTTHDSGNGGYNIIYEAYPGQIPIISGGIVVTNWSLFNGGSNIWSAFVGVGVNSRQLYVNGVRAIRARSTLNPPGFDVTSKGFTTISMAMQSWGNTTNIEIVERNAWKQLRCPVASISGSNIIMQTPGWTYTGNSPTPGPPWNGDGTVSFHGVSWVENAYELLASPGMWYLNQATGYLYYMPHTDENMTNAIVVLPVVEKLVDTSGGSLATPVHNIVFSGITFEYATWLLPSTSAGYADNQTSILWPGPTGALKTLGNVSFQTASHIQITNCVFEHLGGSAIDFGGGAQSNIVVGNHIEDVSSDGISLGEVTGYATVYPGQMTDGNVIQDNYIRRIGQEYEDAIPIWVGYAKNTLIAHNDIDNTPYSGICIGWGWGTASYANNNQVVGNYVGNVMETLSDGGSCYTLSAQTNSWETGNYYKDSCGQGVYWDEGTSFYTAISNVIDNCAYNYVNIHSSGGTLNNRSDVATNNFSNVTAQSEAATAASNCVITNTVFVTGENWPPAAQAIIQNAGLEPGYQPVQLTSQELNDSQIPAAAYQGSNWSVSNGRGYGDYDDDVHYTTIDGDDLSYTFFGTGISYVTEVNIDEGNVDIYLDGVYQTAISCFATNRLPQQTLYTTNNLSSGTHKLKIVKSGGTYMLVDALVVTGNPEIYVNDSDASFEHIPTDWTYSSSRGLGDYHSDVHYTVTNGQYVQYAFAGVGITWIGELNTDEGNVDVYLDGNYQTTVNCYSSTRVAQDRLFTSTNLLPGAHTLKLVKNGGSYMLLDAFAIAFLNQQQLFTGFTVNGNGSATLNFAGTPGCMYVAQFSTNLTAKSAWQNISTNVMGNNGLWQFTDTRATNTTGFYRVLHQP